MPPAKLRSLRVMLSSRVDDPDGALPDGTKLRTVRDRLGTDLMATLFTDDPLFEVWTNEGAAAQASDRSIDEHCRDAVDQADVVLVLYNGRAGWASRGLEGICMTELRVALDRAPHKVRVVRLPLVDSNAQIDLDFREYVDDQRLWMSQEVENYEGIVEQSRRALRDAVAEMAHTQARQGSKRYSAMHGDALRWRHLDYPTRAGAMQAATAEAFLREPGSQDFEHEAGARLVAIAYGNARILLRVAAIPAAMGVATAREMVGQPFLRDHVLAGRLTGKLGGPVHVIVCHGGVTESQAIRQLGFPDATIVPTSFGVYVADEVQKVQMVLLRDCTSPAACRFAVQSLLDWLESSLEGTLLAERAEGRRQVVKLLAKLSG